MPWIAGIDEVGYGPLLGPLVVSTALFEVADPAVDLWDALSRVVRRRPARDALAVCDSKLLHRPDDLRPLERTAVSFWNARDGATERTFFEFVSAHCPEAGDQLAAAPGTPPPDSPSRSPTPPARSTPTPPPSARPSAPPASGSPRSTPPSSSLPRSTTASAASETRRTCSSKPPAASTAGSGTPTAPPAPSP